MYATNLAQHSDFSGARETETMCPHARRHPAQNWPHGPIVDRCRDCGAVV